ncbi:hypothetical protein [Actinophytocola sp.]|nr:hypothetical protein [Actinophytocola sp.]
MSAWLAPALLPALILMAGLAVVVASGVVLGARVVTVREDDTA